MKACLLILVVILFVAPLGAQSVESPASDPESVMSAPAAQTQGTNSGDLQFPVFRTLGGMGLVVSLIAAAYFAARKYAPKYFGKSMGEKNLRIVETLSMGDRRSVSLIEVANQRFLIGHTSHQINLIATLPDSVSLVSAPEEEAADGPGPTLRKEPRMPFKRLFDVEKRRPTKSATHPIPDDIRTKMRQLREALERP